MRLVSFSGLFFVLILLCPSAHAQDGDGFVEAKLLNAPKVSMPKEARETGLGGKVNVHVNIDEAGNVTSVIDVSGPDYVCRSVTRPDVVAIRNTARNAAQKAKFSPAKANGSPLISTSSISFDFPVVASKNEKSFSATGEKHYQTEKTPENSDGSLTLMNGKAIELPKPKYPPAAKAVKAAGTVGIQVLILEDGEIFSAEAVSGHPLLRPASVIAACGAKFTQTLLEGKSVKVSGIISYNFVAP